MTDRKQYPLATGLLDYFPDALMEVAHVSYVATEQHHPGAAMHWDRSKSTDEPDALMRHLLRRGTRDADGQRHSAKVAWRALALLQKEIEAEVSTLEAGEPKWVATSGVRSITLPDASEMATSTVHVGPGAYMTTEPVGR